MTKIKLIVAFISISMAIGCAKNEPAKIQSQQQKTQETKAEAEKTLAELATSLPKLRAHEDPNETWSEADLKAYGELIDANELGLNKLASLNGKDGIRISGEASLEESRTMVNQKRTLLQATRNKLAENSVLKEKEKTIGDLEAKYDADVAYLHSEGPPSKSWPEERLAKYEQTVTDAEKNLHDLEVATGSSVKLSANKLALSAYRGMIDIARK